MTPYEIVEKIRVVGDMYENGNGRRPTDIIVSTDLFVETCRYTKEENNGIDPFVIYKTLHQIGSDTTFYGYRVSVVVSDGMWFVFGDKNYIKEI